MYMGIRMMRRIEPANITNVSVLDIMRGMIIPPILNRQGYSVVEAAMMQTAITVGPTIYMLLSI